MALVKGACSFFEFEFKISYRIRVYGVYLEIGQQSMLQQIHCRKDLEKIYKKRLYENGRIRKFIADNNFVPIQNASRIFLKTQSGFVCYKFSNSSVFVETFFVDLFEIFPAMYFL